MSNDYDLYESNSLNKKTLEELCDEAIIGEVCIGGVQVIVDPNLIDLTYNEAVNYINFIEAQKREKSDRLTKIILKLEPDNNISIDWTIKPLPFNRIRRITGYLVGDLNRWNNAKLAEERDRVQHPNTMGR